MQFFGTVILPEKFRYFSTKDDLSLVDDFLKDHLEGYALNRNQSYQHECFCRELSCKAETFNFFKEQIKDVNKKWDSLNFKNKQKTTIYRIDPDLSNMIKSYLEYQKNLIGFDPQCLLCNGTGIATSNSNPIGKFSYFEKKAPFQISNLQNPKYPLSIFKVKDITIATNNLILPDKTWLSRPGHLFDLNFNDYSPEEWESQIFFKNLQPYLNNFAVLLTFSF